MKIAITLAFIFVVGCEYHQPGFSAKPKAKSSTPGAVSAWKKANFKGLKVGSDKRSRALELFGRPTSSGNPEEQDVTEPLVVDYYEEFDEDYTRVLITSSKADGEIYNVIATPRNVTIDWVRQKFGPGYTSARYKILSCPGDTTTSRIIEASDGLLEHIEYRDAGITIVVENITVGDIVFLGRPYADEISCP